MTNYNGGLSLYGDRPKDAPIFFRACDRATKTVTILSGQVLKGRSFLESDTTGKCKAHSGINEKGSVLFADILAAKTVILAGLTFTSGAGGCTKEDLTLAFQSLTVGTTAAQANASNPVGGGTFTSGTLTGYNTEGSTTAATVVFVSTTPYAGVTDLADTGNGSGTTITVTSVNSPQKPIAGVLVFDVDASDGDVEASAYIEASFYANALVWKVDPAVDTITLKDGTTKACTSYNTGCAGTTDASNLLKKKFVEGSEFSELGFQTAGEVY